MVPSAGVVNQHIVSMILKKLGFNCRINGSHYIFFKVGIEEIINIQPLSDNKAKAYQVKQIRFLILRYKLNFANNEQV